MWIYKSELTIGAAAVVTLLAMLWLVTKKNPVETIVRAIRYALADHKALALVVIAYALIPFNLLEERVEAHMSSSVTWDFTGAVSKVGTNLILFLQRLQWAPLTHLFTFVYVVLFTVIMLAAMLVYLANRDYAALKNHVISYWINYLVALPFYLWFPVNEAWAGGRGVKFLIPQVFPGFDQIIRPHSGLDNCLPSLHTSLALTYALVAWRQGYRRLATVLTTCAALVMFSTLYLGVHWVPDMVFGSVLAVFASGYLTFPSPATAEGRLGTTS